MTKEKAMEILETQIKCTSTMCNKDCHLCTYALNEKEVIGAFLMAIKALEKSEIIYDKDELKKIVATQIKMAL